MVTDIFVTTHLEYGNVVNMEVVLGDHLGVVTDLECGSTDSFEYFIVLS